MVVISNCQQMGVYGFDLEEPSIETLALGLTEFILGSRASHAKTRTGR